MMKHRSWMWLLCLIPLLLIVTLPVAGINFNATWLWAIVLLGGSLLPMLTMHKRERKKVDNMNE